MTLSEGGLRTRRRWPNQDSNRRRCRLLRRDADGGRLVRFLLAALRLQLQRLRLQRLRLQLLRFRPLQLQRLRLQRLRPQRLQIGLACPKDSS